MGKNEFDIDFDFEEEYGFDPKSFLDADDYNKEADLDAFTDEELGLTSQMGDPDDRFDLDDDDMDDFLNMAAREEPEEEDDEEEYEEEYEEDDDVTEYAPEEEPEYQEDEEPEFLRRDQEAGMREETEYTRQDYPAEYEEAAEDVVYEEEIPYEEGVSYDETIPEDEEEEQPRKKHKEHKAIVLPKLPKLPKREGPTLFSKFFDLYFAPVFHKELREEPQNPDAPRRRRRKSRKQIFKEFYLPPILVCVSLVLVMSFLVGALSNAIALKKIEDETKKNQLDASISAAEQAELQNDRIVAQAAQLAAQYDYEGATTLIRTINGGDLTPYPEIAAKLSEYETIKSQLVEHKEPSLIPNLSFHVLVADMVRAQKDTDQLKSSYNMNFVTIDEFSRILQELYANNFVLVDFDSFAQSNSDLDGTEKFFITPIKLPANKKPVMITETMVNYFEYMVDGDQDGVADAKGDGFASRLVLDANGDFRNEYVDENGQTQVGNYDLVPILEDFIKEHPDFSYQGARATLAVTGHEGVFGYRCNTKYIGTKSQDFYDQQVAGAKQIVSALQERGYTIACYTYKNDDYAKFSVAQISADLQSWTNEVTNVIGPVDTIVFAKNSNIIDYTGQAFNVLYTSGFRYFVARSDKPSCEVNATYVRQNRLLVTGENMRHYPSQFTDLGLFNPNSVLDLTSRGGEIPKAG